MKKDLKPKTYVEYLCNDIIKEYNTYITKKSNEKIEQHIIIDIKLILKELSNNYKIIKKLKGVD